MEEFFDVDENHATTAASTVVDNHHHLNVDTSRPFRSVKEAVAIFGERILVGEVYSSKAFAFSKEETPIFSPSQKVSKESWSNYTTSRDFNSYSYNDVTLSDTVKKLETELEETKAELKLLKEKESDTEAALASLNAELHNNMSKLQAAQAAAGAGQMEVDFSRSRGEDIDDIIEVELEKKMENASSRSLAQILSVGQKEGLFVGKKKDKIKVMKKKPIIPLVGGFLSWKKRSATSMHNPLYASSHLHWN